MGKDDRRRRTDEELRRRVLDTAEEIIAREGVANVTMRRIAASVDYAPTVLYRLFDGKADLLDHLIARGYEGVRNGYEEVAARGSLRPVDALRATLEAYIAYAMEHPNHYRMWFETGTLRLDDGRLLMTHGRLEYTVYETWFECIEACRAAGLFPRLETLEAFQVVWARVHGLISLRLQHPAFPWMPLDRHLEEMLELPAD